MTNLQDHLIKHHSIDRQWYDEHENDICNFEHNGEWVQGTVGDAVHHAEVYGELDDFLHGLHLSLHPTGDWDDYQDDQPWSC